MKHPPLDDAAWMRRRFPDAKAREAADRAVDAMEWSTILDVWLAAYEKSAKGERK